MILPFLLTALTPFARGSDAKPVDDFACLDQHGVFQRLSRHADARLVVLYVYTDDCPIARHNSLELAALMRDFEGRGVRFLGLDPAPQDTRDGIATSAQELGLAFPILKDDTQCVAEMLEITRSGEALVLVTRDWRLAWRGPLDDRLEYGAQRAEAGRHYLRETLEALLGERPPPTDAPLSKGCAITLLQPREKHEVSYERDVAPLLQEHCVACHRAGGIAPWAMNGYERVRGWSAMMREVLLQRRMPPWHADPLHGRFVEDSGPGPDEVRTLVHWIERGAPRGTGPDPLANPPPEPSEWPLGPPDLIVELPEQELPATGLVPYRLPVVRLDLAEDRWVRAVDLRPSNPTVLHHGFAFIQGEQERNVIEDRLSRMPPERQARARKWLERHGGSLENPPPAAYELAAKFAFQGLSTYFSKYVPGQTADVFPPGTGKRLTAGASLLFQLHYTTNGTKTTDRPRLGIYFHAEQPARELRVTSALNTGFVIPAGERAYEVSAERLFDRNVRLFALAPHMHYRGRAMRFTALLPDGGREVLLSVPEYEFDWQMTYTLAEPRAFPAGTRLLCEGVFDNSAQNERNPNPRVPVHMGPRTTDEMFIGYAVYSEE